MPLTGGGGVTKSFENRMGIKNYLSQYHFGIQYIISNNDHYKVLLWTS